MKAVVIRAPGGADVLKIEELPIPKPEAGKVLIKIKAFGLNRSELFTRQGHSPGVKFPRVLGIECCGIVEACPGGEFKEGEKVMTVSAFMFSPTVLGEVQSMVCSVRLIRSINSAWAASAAPSTAAMQNTRSCQLTKSSLSRRS